MTFFFAARSANDIALIIFSFDLVLLAAFTADSSLFKMTLFTPAFLLELRSALFAVLVTGIP